MTRQDELNEAWCKYMNKCSTEIMQALAFALRWCDEHPHWISVEDELPPNNGSGFSNEVLAYDSMYWRWMITSYDYRCNLWLMCERVTHWMPLPQPPKTTWEEKK